MDKQPINVTKNVMIEFTPQQISLTIAILRKGVYEQVSPVINSIEGQIMEQCKPKEEVLVNGQMEPN